MAHPFPPSFRPGQFPIPKQEEMYPSFEDTSQTSSHHYYPLSAIGSWSNSDSVPGTGAMMPCQQLGYDHPWTPGVAQGYEADQLYTSGLPEMSGHQFDFPGVSPSHHNMTRANPEVTSLIGCKDLFDWPVGQPVGSNPQHSEGMMASNPMAPSPSFSTQSHHSLQYSNGSASPVKSQADHDELRASSGDEDGNADPPYSLLIYHALRSAPEMKLPLQGIYSWFEKNTEKGKDQGSKGWQNSIRHNLSMNAGFEAIREETRGKRAVNFWRLTDEAVRNGIQSTTRYRKQANCRKTLSLEPPAPLRQRSGARGGKAAKVTAKLRHTHSHADELRKERQHHHHGARPTPVSTSAAARRRNEDHAYLHSPFPVQSSSTAHMTHHRHHHLTAETFNDLRYVVGCTEYSPTTPIFCDMDPGESAMGWCSIQSAPSYWAGLEISTDLHIGV